MKNLLSIFFIVVILGNTLSLSLYYLYFNMNTAYITELFCINKENKVLQCHGKCHLKKVTTKLAGQEQDSKAPIPRFEEGQSINLFLQQYHIEPLLYDFNTYPPHHRYANTYRFLFTTSIFHPPESSSWTKQVSLAS